MNEPSDRQVITAVLAGDTDEYAVLVRRYQKQIFNLMLRATGSQTDASDLAQETFIRAFEQLSRFDLERKFFTWIYSIGLNKSRNFLRRKRILRTVPIDEAEPDSGLDYPGQQEEVMCSMLDVRNLRHAMEKLPFDYSEALFLRYHEELPMEEVAAALGLSVSGAKMRVHRGLKMLRQVLEENRHEKEIASGR